MTHSVTTLVDPPVGTTALIADLRNFTPNLNASKLGDDGVNTFCDFLATFYGDCLEACLVALPAPVRGEPPVYVSSTGDGVLAIFRGDRHAERAYLAAILMDAILARRCAAYARDPRFAGAPGTSYGIGVESGEASRTSRSASQLGLDTYIGHCVNVASRAESITKTLQHANTIVADTAVERVSAALFGRTFEELRVRERVVETDDERAALHDEMERLNRELCVVFIGRHVLKGVDAPTPLYRFARTAMSLGVPRFERLLRRLVSDDATHLAEVRARLAS